MSAHDLVAGLGHAIGLSGLSLNADGLCRLCFDGKVVVDIEDDGTVMHLYSVLGRVPVDGRERLYERMLAANLFGSGTGGAVLALDPLQDELVLCRAVSPDGLDVTGFVAVIEGFVGQVELWQRTIASPAAEDEPAPTPDPVPLLRV